jgi:hypothetical protein
MNKYRKAIILEGIVLAVCLSATVLSSSRSEQSKVENRLRKLAGRGATDCGYVGPQTDPSVSSECVLKSFANRQPFYVLYDTQELRVDSYFIDALAGDKSGSLFDVEFSSRGWDAHALPAGAKLLDGRHILVEPCQKPIALGKSIYKGLTCIPRITDTTIR